MLVFFLAMRSLFFIAKFRRVFCTKTIKSRLFKKYLKINTRWHPFVCILVCCYIACWNKQEARHWAHPTSFGKGRWFLIKFVNLVPQTEKKLRGFLRSGDKLKPLYISNIRVPMATKLGGMVTYLDGILPIKSNDSFIKWPYEITWQTKTTIYPLSEWPWPPSLLRW